MRDVGRGRSLETYDVQAYREQVKDVSSSGLREDYRDCRTVVVRRAYLSVDGRQPYVNLMKMRSGAVMMVIAVGLALVHVQHGRLGVEAEESQAEEDRDRPHPDKSTSLGCGRCGCSDP